jgi:hypothetical protein
VRPAWRSLNRLPTVVPLSKTKKATKTAVVTAPQIVGVHVIDKKRA